MRGLVPALRFWMYHDTQYSALNDQLQVQVSTNGGASWTNVGAAIPRYDGSTGWKEHVVDLSAYSTQVDLRVGFLGISGWGNDIHIDDVVLGAGCLPRPGGLVVGNVYDGNTGAPLAGALVASDGGYTATTAVTEDPAVPDSFYTLFSSPGSHVLTATMSGYGTAVSTTNVVQSGTVRLDFYLTAPHLAYAPASMSVVLTKGLTTTLPLTLANTGSFTLTFELEEWSGTGSDDLPWLSAEPVTGTILPGGYQVVGVTFDSRSAAPGTHTAALRIRTNDPQQPQANLPVTMTVFLPYRVYLPLVVRNLGP